MYISVLACSARQWISRASYLIEIIWLFIFAPGIFFIPAQNQYYNKNLNQDLEFIDILFDGKFPHLDTLFLMGFQN